MVIVWEAVGATILPNIGGWLSTPLTIKSVKGWYKTLARPSWTPPDYVFGPVWTCLYTGMGFASYLVWRDGGGFSGEARTALTLYGAQLAINWAWSPIFFGLHKIGAGLIIAVSLWGTAGAAALAMSRVNQTAGLLMVPYMMWLTLANTISFYLWRNNPPRKDKKKE
ncbi:translocator protein isoform X2 [Cloeon dipterum]|uniref:translocator protein isoform X2 n=1 Tax=Cloeon dipterum TaxID=197152 RepID=UPI00321F8CBE